MDIDKDPSAASVGVQLPEVCFGDMGECGKLAGHRGPCSPTPEERVIATFLGIDVRTVQAVAFILRLLASADGATVDGR